MIEINLLAEELKEQRKRIPIKIKSLLYIVPLVFSLLILLHTCLFITSLVNGQQLHWLEKKWLGLEPQRKKLEDLRRESNIVLQDSKVVQEISSQMMNWAQKLNALSLNLPSGIWFNEISYTNKKFTLKASVVSLQKEEINSINKFLENLKKDTTFFQNFYDLELGPLQRKTIGSYDIVDFILLGRLK